MAYQLQYSRSKKVQGFIAYPWSMTIDPLFSFPDVAIDPWMTLPEFRVYNYFSFACNMMFDEIRLKSTHHLVKWMGCVLISLLLPTLSYMGCSLHLTMPLSHKIGCVARPKIVWPIIKIYVLTYIYIINLYYMWNLKCYGNKGGAILDFENYWFFGRLIPPYILYSFISPTFFSVTPAIILYVRVPADLH